MRQVAMDERWASPGVTVVRIVCNHKGGRAGYAKPPVLHAWFYRRGPERMHPGDERERWDLLPPDRHQPGGGLAGFGPSVHALYGDNPLNAAERAQVADLAAGRDGTPRPRKRYTWRCRCGITCPAVRHETLEVRVLEPVAEEAGEGCWELLLVETRRLLQTD